MHHAQALRLEYERGQIIMARQAILRDLYFEWTLTRQRDEILPSPADVAFSPYFVVETHAPSSLMIDEVHLRRLDFLFPMVAAHWREEKTRELVRMLPAREGAPPRTAADLELATTFF